MYNDAEKCARQLLDLYFGNAEGAQTEVFEMAKHHPLIPNKFWLDVQRRIVNEARSRAIAASM